MLNNRTCGTCTLCCSLIPVDEVDKVSNQRCKYQCSKGCRVYRTPAQPLSCVYWQCQWLAGEDVGERPDRSHAVVDIMMDGIGITSPTGERQQMMAVQVWCDPHHRHAHRNPRLRAWLATFTQKHNAAVIVRYSSGEGIVLFPPWLTGSDWYESESNVRPKDSPETIEDKRKLGIPVVDQRDINALIDDYKARNMGGGNG